MTDRDPFLANHLTFGRLGAIEALPEFALLHGENIAATPGGAEADLDVEAKRTKMSADCFDDVCWGDMRKFALLEENQRDHLRGEVAALSEDPDVVDAVRYGLTVHDICKNEDVLVRMGLSVEFDHDEAFGLLLNDATYEELRSELLPTYEQLTSRTQYLLRSVAGIRSNYPQILQGEAPAATLEDLHSQTNPLIRDIDIIIKQFDIFGARGHINQDVSLAATPGTYRAMQNLNRALRDPTLTTVQERNNAFLDAEIEYFLGPAASERPQGRTALRTLARLGRFLRVEDKEAFGRLAEDFDAQPGVVKEILLTELSRGSRATLAYYSPDLVRTVTNMYDGKFALTYLAHVLQEAHIADKKARQAGLPGILTVQLGEVMRAMHGGRFDPKESTVRFAPRGGALVAEAQAPSLENIDDLPEFAGETLRNKRIVLVGEGGGSDGIQAAMLGKLFARKYGCEIAAVVSVRNEERVVTGTEQRIGRTLKKITPQTVPVGDWRFLEKIPLEGDEQSPMYLLNSTNPDIIASDIETLADTAGAEVVVGIDTGGDSLYRAEHAGFSAHLPTDITPDQDYYVIQGLTSMATSRPDIPTLSTIVAPGVDSPKYARSVLKETGAARLMLSDEDIALIQSQYAEWRMDGLGSEEGRYGKTPLAWLHALQGNFGFQLLNLPRANVLSDDNPWRAFTIITRAMAGIVIMDMKDHFRAIERKES